MVEKSFKAFCRLVLLFKFILTSLQLCFQKLFLCLKSWKNVCWMFIIIAKNVETWKSVFYFITPWFKLHCAKFWKTFRKALKNIPQSFIYPSPDIQQNCWKLCWKCWNSPFNCPWGFLLCRQRYLLAVCSL